MEKNYFVFNDTKPVVTSKTAIRNPDLLMRIREMMTIGTDPKITPLRKYSKEAVGFDGLSTLLFTFSHSAGLTKIREDGWLKAFEDYKGMPLQVKKNAIRSIARIAAVHNATEAAVRVQKFEHGKKLIFTAECSLFDNGEYKYPENTGKPRLGSSKNIHLLVISASAESRKDSERAVKFLNAIGVENAYVAT